MEKLQLDGKKTAEIRKKTCTICMNALQNGTRRLAADEKNDMYKIQENFPKIFHGIRNSFPKMTTSEEESADKPALKCFCDSDKT